MKRVEIGVLILHPAAVYENRALVLLAISDNSCNASTKLASFDQEFPRESSIKDFLYRADCKHAFWTIGGIVCFGA